MIETEDLADSSSGLGIGGRRKPTARERHGGVKKSVVRRGDARASHAASGLLSPGARRRPICRTRFNTPTSGPSPSRPRG